MPSSSPMPSQLRPNKRTRLHQKMSTLDEVDENQPTVDTATVSTAASEASSRASNTSQPPLLDFIGNTCMASAWFTSCFPCAVVDINDSDDYVVDKLSRESAMNVMYSSQPPAGGDSSRSTNGRVSLEKQGEDAVMGIQLPRAEETGHQTACTDAPIHSAPHVIAEKDHQEEDEDVLDTISLNDDAGHPCLEPVSPDRVKSDITGSQKSDITGSQRSQSSRKASFNEPKSPQKKKKKFGIKIFGRKN